MTMFDLSDYLVSNILLPLGALLIAIFVGFKMPKSVLINEIKTGSTYGKRIFAVWFLIIKYVAPIAIIIVFLGCDWYFEFLILETSKIMLGKDRKSVV